MIQKRIRLFKGIPDGSAKVASCIYCGATEGLTDEHTIPFALWGTGCVIDGSCLSCAQKISAVELFVLRRSLSFARQFLGAPSRHAKKRGHWSGLANLKGDLGEELELPIGSVAQSIGFVTFPYLPRDLLKIPKGEQHRSYGIQMFALSNFQDPAASGLWGPTAKFNDKTWARFIAKVAYGEYIRCVDADFRSPRLSCFIVNGVGDQSRFVGSRTGAPQIRCLHNVEFLAFRRSGGSYAITVYLRFLTFVGSPSYIVYLGELPRGSEVPERLQVVLEWGRRHGVWPRYPASIPRAEFPPS